VDWRVVVGGIGGDREGVEMVACVVVMLIMNIGYMIDSEY
jgi:hypothetical protein